MAVGQRSAAYRQPQPCALAAGVYRTNDGYVAINVAVEEHWHNLLAAIGREDSRDDPRFKTSADRVAHVDETDALIGAWTATLGKMEVFAIVKRHRIPCAPVRDVGEVMHDRARRDRPHCRPDVARAYSRCG